MYFSKEVALSHCVLPNETILGCRTGDNTHRRSPWANIADTPGCPIPRCLPIVIVHQSPRVAAKLRYCRILLEQGEKRRSVLIVAEDIRSVNAARHGVVVVFGDVESGASRHAEDIND